MKNVYLLCNAHIDPIWLWKWQEGAAEAISTFRTAADFCEESDEFVFNHNEALLYEWIEEHEPELFERIQKLVADGKWHINERVKLRNIVASEIAEKYSIPVIDLYDITSVNINEISSDGVHPTEPLYEKIADEIIRNIG